MRHVIYRWYFSLNPSLLIKALSVVLLLSSPLSKAETLTFGCSPGSDDRFDSSLMRDITGLIALDAGYEVKFIDYPWARVVAKVEAGTLTGSHCMSYTKERESWINFLPTPFLEQSLRFFHLRENEIPLDSLEELLKLRIVVHKDSFIESVISSLGAKDVITVHDGLVMCRMLKAKRVDLIAMTLGTKMECHHHEEHKSISVPMKAIGPELHKEYLQLAISKETKNSTEIVNRLNQSFKRLVKAGKVDAIYEKYQLPIPELVNKLKMN